MQLTQLLIFFECLLLSSLVALRLVWHQLIVCVAGHVGGGKNTSAKDEAVVLQAGSTGFSVV